MNSSGQQGRAAGVREIVALPVGVVQQPVRRWLQRRAERKEIAERSKAVKRQAGELMREFHEALWNRWGPEAIENVLVEGKEPK